MPRPYRQPHWNAFIAAEHYPQGPIGFPPSSWVTRFQINGVPNVQSLSIEPLNRHAVRAICTDRANDVLFGYVCVMAWGGQFRRNHVALAWSKSDEIATRLNTLRTAQLNRHDAYNLFCGAESVPGLGPSYFTKLLYFFCPTPTFYIMDQWTAKSVNMLTANWVVRMNGNAPSNQNKGGNYQAYGEEVDSIASFLGCTGEEAEERLFSQGGHRPWPWRTRVRQRWSEELGLGYNATTTQANYPHILITDF